MKLVNKKWMSVVLTGAVALSLTACAGNAPANTGSASNGSGAGASKSKYPEKPITITVPSGAGGGIDMAARALAKVADKTKLVSQSITVENKPGGGQVVGTVEFANKEKKNDYKLILPSTNLVLNFLKKDGNSPVSFRDVTPLARLQVDYGVLAVKTDSKYQDLKSLFDDVKANPSKVTFAGGSAPGSFDYLNVVLPAVKAGIDGKAVKYISYDGGGEAMTSLLGGNADVLSTDTSGVAEYLRSGKVRILGVSSAAQLSGQFKDIKTYKEQGLEVEVTNWRGIFGPKEMTADAKKYWEDQIKAIVSTEDWKKELEAQGVQDGYLNAADFQKALEKDEAVFKEIYTSLGMAK